jgi:hypothetical protein
MKMSADGDVGISSSVPSVPTRPTAPDVLPQFANMPSILNPDSTRESVMGYVRRNAR